MPRPRLCRRIFFKPSATFFKPSGVRLVDLEQSVLSYDELESVRLKDYEGADQVEAAKKMDISQPTFHRLLVSARKKIADALVNGKSIRIQGGVFKMVPAGMGLGRGRGLGGGFGLGPSGECRCPKCGSRIPHTRGKPCYQHKCPKCGAIMTRG
jgi:predicted DNA-binding protein (UPF0251 family)